MRRVTAAAVAAAAVAAWAAPSASAAPATITGLANNTFNAPSYAHDAGTLAQLVVTGSNHNVTAVGNGPDGNVLFSSPTIAGGSTGVNGSQYVEPGVHPFICTIHPATMAATLNVSGTPLARPAVKLKFKTRKLRQAVRSSEVKVKVTITGGQGELADVAVKLGKKTIGDGQTGTTRTLKIPLSSKGHRRLEKRGKAKLKAEATIPFGAPATAKRRLK